MRKILQIFAASILIFIAVQKNNANTGIATLEKNDDYNSMVIVAMFEKLNWIIKELKNVSQQCSDLDIKQNIHLKLSTNNLLSFKSEIRELWQQQEIKTEKLLWKMQQEVLKNFEVQENLLKNTTVDIKNLQSCDITSFKQKRNWQTILRRQDGSENFNRSWNEYKTGFGKVNGEFFIGLEALHVMTTYADPQELLIVLRDFANQTRYAKYSDFVIGSESEKYEIKKIGKYRGDANDAFSTHLHYKFSTYDRDNDNAYSNCAVLYPGGWWFSNCFDSHLTGQFLYQPTNNTGKTKGIVWHSWHGFDYSLKYAEMMIRPK